MTEEAVNYFNNFSDLSVKKKIENSEQKKVNDSKNAVSESIKNIDIFTQKVNKSTTDSKTSQDEFGDIFKKKNIDHIKEHIVANKRFAEKYVNNPSEALKDENVMVKFSADEAAEIEKQLKDENSLTLFSELIRNKELTGKDVLECLKRFNKLTKSQKKNMFFASMSADEVEKMDPEKMARRLTRNIKKLAKLRKAMSPEDRAFIAEMLSKAPEKCEEFLDKFIEDRKVYKNKDIKEIAKNMEEMSDKEKIDYTENISELGEIKDENDNPKYEGTVNVKVAKHMVDEPKAHNAIINTAKKDDMDGKHLLGISSNLVKNPDMIPSYEQLLGTKDSKGNDKFGKEALLNQTNYMVDKSVSEIEKYTGKVLEYAKYDSISGDEATAYGEKVMSDPSSEATVDAMVETKAALSGELTEDTSDNSDSADIPNTTSGFSLSTVETFTSVTNNNIFKTENDSVDSNETEADKKAYYQKLATDFRAKYGTAADTMIQLCLEKPEVVKALFTNPNITFEAGMAIIKKYGYNVALLSEIAKNPRNIDKIKFSSASITTPQLVELVKLSEKRGVDFVVQMIQKYSPSKAITICSSPDSDKIKTQMKKNSDSKESQEYLNYHFSREFVA